MKRKQWFFIYLYSLVISAIVILTACSSQIKTKQPTRGESLSPSTAIMTLTTVPSGITPVSNVAMAVTPTATAGLLEAATPGWISYTNADYGFSFLYPSTWTIQGAPNMLRLTRQSLTLAIGYKWASENVRLGPGNIPAGDFITKNTVKFLEQEVQREVLVYDGKVKAVFYTLPGNFEIPMNIGQGEATSQVDLVFAIGLQVFDTDYQQIDIPEMIQNETDQIVASFKLIR
jgi:hypothetical protein